MNIHSLLIITIITICVLGNYSCLRATKLLSYFLLVLPLQEKDCQDLPLPTGWFVGGWF